jgi:hypothetical protein
MAMKNDFKVLWNDIKRSPGLLIAIIVVIIAVLYVVYRQNNPSTPTDTTNTTQPTYRVETFSITPPASGGTTDTTPTTPAPPTHSQLITSTTGWLASTPGGTNNKGQNIMNLPSGATLSLISGPVSFGSNKYYKVTYQGKTGYVNAKTVGLA